MVQKRDDFVSQLFLSLSETTMNTGKQSHSSESRLPIQERLVNGPCYTNNIHVELTPVHLLTSYILLNLLPHIR